MSHNSTPESTSSIESTDLFDDELFGQPDDSGSSSASTNGLSPHSATGQPSFDKSTIADLVAKYGSSSATAWLEFDRYLIWRAPPDQVPESSFPPVQGYMARQRWVFAWGDPLVSDPIALEATARVFISWVRNQGLNLVWCCADLPLEKVLAKLGWSTVECIYEDVLNPEHIVQLTSPDAKGHEGQHIVKDLRKNLRRADKANVTVVESTGRWTEEMRQQVIQGIVGWKRNRDGVQIASTNFQAFTDEAHRRYWIAQHENKIVGLLILTPMGPTSYLIKNVASFPDAPRGTSEALIHSAIESIHREEQETGQSITVSFGITAADDVKPVDNLSGWRITSLSKIYHSVTTSAGLLKRGNFRSKFDAKHQPMYVCYDEKLGVEGIRALLKLLRK